MDELLQMLNSRQLYQLENAPSLNELEVQYNSKHFFTFEQRMRLNVYHLIAQRRANG